MKDIIVTQNTRVIINCLKHLEEAKELYHTALIEFYGGNGEEMFNNEKWDDIYVEVINLLNHNIREQLNSKNFENDIIGI